MRPPVKRLTVALSLAGGWQTEEHGTARREHVLTEPCLDRTGSLS